MAKRKDTQTYHHIPSHTNSQKSVTWNIFPMESYCTQRTFQNRQYHAPPTHAAAATGPDRTDETPLRGPFFVFENVSALVYSLCKVTVQRTFQKRSPDLGAPPECARAVRALGDCPQALASLSPSLPLLLLPPPPAPPPAPPPDPHARRQAT